MTSVVSICNRALASIGTRSTIASLTEQSTEAKQCNLIYEATRDEVLSMAFWNFARKTDTLALLKSAPGTPTNTAAANSVWSKIYPAPPWLFEYSYPADAIQVRYISPQPVSGYIGPIPIFSNDGSVYTAPVQGQQYPAVPFVVAIDQDADANDINVVLTNQYQALVVYTRRITDPNIFSSQFTQALVAALAAKLAQALTGKLALSNAKFQEANGWVIQARASDGNEGLTVIDNMPDWITIREDYGSAYLGYFVAPFGPLFSV